MTAPSSSADVGNQFVVTDWDSLLSVDQNVGFGGSAGLSSHNVGPPVSELMDCTNFSSIKHVPLFSSLSSESFSACSQTTAAPCTSLLPSSGEHRNEKNSKGQKRKELSECAALHPHSLLNKIQNVKTEHRKDVLLDTVESQMEKDGNKSITELDPGVNNHYSTAKLADVHPHDHGRAAKEDYIHVRAKRGQATSSHSLAERIRRERISERMRFLQDLVPGCKKVTGKAMMLDEIINYVQSLQRQVEFLSMKLSAVNPQVNLDIEQLIAKDNLCLQDGSPAIDQFGADLSINHPHLHGAVQQDSMQVTPPESGASLFLPMAQISSAWDVENGLHMGFISNPPLNHAELNAKLKLEL